MPGLLCCLLPALTSASPWITLLSAAGPLLVPLLCLLSAACPDLSLFLYYSRLQPSFNLSLPLITLLSAACPDLCLPLDYIYCLTACSEPLACLLPALIFARL